MSNIDDKLQKFEEMPRITQYQLIEAGEEAINKRTELYGTIDTAMQGSREHCREAFYLFDDVIIAAYQNVFTKGELRHRDTMWRVIYREDGRWKRTVTVYMDKGEAIAAGLAKHYGMSDMRNQNNQ